jgi:Spy/CpxP family protein refolding chaperone
MVTRKATWILVPLLLWSLGLTAPAFAGPWGRGCSGLAGATPLTPAQSSQIFTLKQKFFHDTADLRRQMVQKRAELAALWQAPTPDQAKIAAKQKELNALRGQLQQKGFAFQMQVRKIAPGAVPRSGWGPGGKRVLARGW